jgi:hypothetical protein
MGVERLHVVLADDAERSFARGSNREQAAVGGTNCIRRSTLVHDRSDVRVLGKAEPLKILDGEIPDFG